MGPNMRIELFEPFDIERRTSRRDPGYQLFRQVYWTAFFAAANRRRAPHKASMGFPVSLGREGTERGFSGLAHPDPILLQ